MPILCDLNGSAAFRGNLPELKWFAASLELEMTTSVARPNLARLSALNGGKLS
jgi:hypothetical protein